MMTDKRRRRCGPLPQWLLLPLLLLFLGSCDLRGVGSVALRIDTLGSGSVVVSNNPPDPDAPPPGWAVREIFRLGSGEGSDPVTAFTGIRDLALDGQGEVYVLDAGAPTIRVFDRQGEHVRDIGGPNPGDGPGEFRDPRTLVIDQEDHLLVMDYRNRRYTAFELDGTLVDTYRRVGGGGNPVAGRDGAIWETITLRSDPESRRALERAFVGKRVQDGVMAPVDTVLRPPPLNSDGWLFQSPSGASGMGAVIEGLVAVPFTPERVGHWDPRGGFWTGTTDVFRFVRISPEGDTLRIVERAAAPRPVTPEDRENAVHALLEEYGEGLRVDPEDIPTVMPQWSDFFIDAEGRLWVQRYWPPGAPPLAPRTWEVYDPEGVYLGALDLMLASDPIPAMRGDRLAGAVTGDLGVPYVVVYELLTGTP